MQMVPWHPKLHPSHSSSKSSVWQIGAENSCCGGCTSSAEGDIIIIIIIIILKFWGNFAILFFIFQKGNIMKNIILFLKF
jgi:hypothetical protein